MGKHENGYSRVPRDYYPTPAWVTAALGRYVDLTGKRVWECACGDGRMAEVLKACGASVYASDIEDRGYSGFHKIDFLTAPLNPRFDAIITNPPGGVRNTVAAKFVEAELPHIVDGGLLALLLPNDFDSAVGRRHLFADCPAFAGKIVLTKRILWFPPPPGERKSPKENHSWFLWRFKPRPRSPIILYAPGASS